MMKISELMKFIQWENKRVEKASGKSNEDLIDLNVLKIGEEYGEFINEFLKAHHWQRKSKMSDVGKIRKEMSEEFADIILVTLLAGDRLKINIEKELKNKIKKVKLRKY